MNNHNRFLSLVKYSLAIFVVGVTADSMAESINWEFTGNVVITHQTANQSRIRNEFAGSSDLLFKRQYGSGNWLGHFEVSTTPESNGVSSILPEANGDIGTALDEKNKRRIQLSELYYPIIFLTIRQCLRGFSMSPDFSSKVV